MVGGRWLSVLCCAFECVLPAVTLFAVALCKHFSLYQWCSTFCWRNWFLTFIRMISNRTELLLYRYCCFDDETTRAQQSFILNDRNMYYGVSGTRWLHQWVLVTNTWFLITTTYANDILYCIYTSYSWAWTVLFRTEYGRANIVLRRDCRRVCLGSENLWWMNDQMFLSLKKWTCYVPGIIT